MTSTPVETQIDTAFFFVVFACIKLAGYTGVAVLARPAFPDAASPPLVIGAARTLLGIIIGFPLGYLGFATLSNLGWFYVGLFPVRIAEWYITIRFFFDRAGVQRGPTRRWLFLGTLASYALDMPVALGFLSVGRAWIC